ncbi:alpha-amylase [Salinimicrobium gaetbulicola]|uniref:Alpha-amylase n=1 Tax=Salinimicrobium gaetbulicola TaxID=999702 RepID=A0ABW3ICS2_9FLAO
MIKRTIFFPLLAVLLILGSCSKDDESPTPEPEPKIETPQPTALDLNDFDNGAGVMMQAFYWDVEPRHEWWDILSEKVEGWADAGINRMWLPVATKGQSGGYSMGYDVSDYFDFGDLYQHGTTETRFGSREELENLIDVSHQHGVEVIADIVINHNSGGGEEYNPYRGENTYTLFDEDHGNASGMFNRDYENFYPNSTSNWYDNSLFYPETNLDHHQEYVQNWLWKNENSVAKYYMNVMGFDGWRFDYVKGFEPWVIKEWLDEVGGFSVGENWDGYSPNLEAWVEETGSGAFDFATFYKLDEAFDRHDDLTIFNDEMLWKTHPDKAVTFTANHDTEKDSNEDNYISYDNKMKAYSFILTHPGYPTIFYSDYENEEFKEKLNKLMLIHNTIATGEVEVLYVDNDEYVMKRSGNATNPGLILYINTGINAKRRSVESNWNSNFVMDYSENTNYIAKTDETGSVMLEGPANGYAVYSIMEDGE